MRNLGNFSCHPWWSIVTIVFHILVWTLTLRSHECPISSQRFVSSLTLFTLCPPRLMAWSAATKVLHSCLFWASFWYPKCGLGFSSPCQWLILPLSPLSFIRLSSDNSGSLLNYIIRLLIAEGFDRYHFWIKWTSWSIVIKVFFRHYLAWSVQKHPPNQYTEKTTPCVEDHLCSKSKLLDSLILSEWR